MESLPSRDELVRLVEGVHPGANPFQRLTDAMILSGRLADMADETIGHFVTQARESGATWAQIGECMGVSKQAVQKQFGSPTRRGGRFFMTRLADQARQVVRDALGHARRSGASEVGVTHVLLALLDDADGTAARILDDLGGPLDELREVVDAGLERGDESTEGHLPFSAATKKVLELALRETIRMGARQIGTEHVLLAMLRDEGTAAAQLLIERGVTRRAVGDRLRED